MIEFVFFDAGETLLGPHPSWSDKSAEVMRERGHDVDPATMREAWIAVGDSFRKVSEEGIVISASHGASYEFWTGLYRRLLAEAGVEDDGGPDVLYETFSNPANYRLFEDALPALAELKDEGYRLGIISNFESWLGDMLDALKILPSFEVVAISGDVGFEKPDPRIFKWAVERAGLDPSQCAHVGDSPFFDAEAAVACGLHAILIDRHGRWAGEGFEFPVVSSLTEIAPLLRR